MTGRQTTMKVVKDTSPSQTNTQCHHIIEESVLPLSGNCVWLDISVLSVECSNLWDQFSAC